MQVRTLTRSLVHAVLALACLSGTVQAATLYTGAGLPASQGWLTYFATGGSQTASAGNPVTVDTTAANGLNAGYLNRSIALFPTPGLGGFINPAFPLLDRQAGFNLDFTLRMNSEASTRPERAGFSVLVITSDKQGIELGFHTSSIFAQDRDFTDTGLAARSAALDTTLSRDYRLSILGNGYQLSSAGSLILGGSLVDYFNTTNSSPLAFVYGQQDFLFMGDNTTSANASFTLGRVELNTAVVPLPAAGWLLLAGLGLLGTAGRRRS
jgi:hypothetical protein